MTPPIPRAVDWAKRYLVPGLVFKSAVIGGAYSSGRELAEFFAPHGVWGGLAGMLAATVLWSCVFAVSLEFARQSRAYDYRTFFKTLLGPLWIPVELLLVLLLLVIVAVLSATAGEMLSELSGLPRQFAVLLFALAVAASLALRTSQLETFLSYWSLALYAFYGVFLVLAVLRFGPAIGASLDRPVVASQLAGGVADGARYGAYNIAAIAMVLFVARNLRSRRQALIAGLLGGPLAMLPAVLFFIAMSAFLSQLSTAVLPVNFLMQRMQVPLLSPIYLTIIFITLIGAAATTLHSLNERIASALETSGRSLGQAARFAVAMLVMCSGVLASLQFGLIELVAHGYGYIAFGFIGLFIAPILTVGLWRIRSSAARP